MKKKFINGILMVALMFAATSSFVSCKDNVDDDIADIYAQLGKKASELQGKIDALRGDVDGLKSDVNDVKGRLSEAEGDITTLKGDVKDLNDSLDAIKNRYDEKIGDIQNDLTIINEWITKQTLKTDSIDKALEGINDRLDNLDDSINVINQKIVNIMELFGEGGENFITGVDIEATRNDVFGTISLPGLGVNGLAAYYGTNETGLEEFPYAGVDYNVGWNRLACYLEDYELPEDGFATLDGDYITDPIGNAGKIYFTVNSADYENFDISKFDVTLENSVGKIAPVKLENIKKSGTLITYALGKASFIDLGTPADNGLYEAVATIAPEDLEANTFGVDKFINLQDIQKQAINAVENVRDANGTGAKNVGKQIVREAAAIVFDLFHGKLTSSEKANNISYAPQRVALYQTAEGVSKRKGQSKFDLYATAVKPLSYNTFWEYEKGKEDNWIIEDALEKAISKVAQVIKQKYNNPLLSAKIIELDDANEAVTVIVGTKTETINIGNTTQYNNLKQAVNVNGGLANVNTMINDLLKEVSLGKAAERAGERINNYLDKASNYIVNLINKHAFTRAIAPIIIFETSTGVDRLAEGMFINRGTMHAYLTSATLEILAPAYKKYVALEKDGVILQSAVLPGNAQTYDFDLSEPGDYKIILSCVDYYGYVITKKYDCYVL